ncbi:MAG: DUF1080 domain-containing protein [Lunatimonas sp.]|uniref:3-keto-disaccharide hydrolase n=1 Tax=Lunatimonas sp. TaxID=2060141 RepID=UPI00263B2F11|nr:DUF1080 domain-containing protein [Lunatimonas sp.]MCC5936248.1 DUF1080 domain-containing protein [Lunatimonas sp.]
MNNLLQSNTLLYILAGILYVSTAVPVQAQEAWEVLFDGTNMDKWRGKTDPAFPSHAWKFKDDILYLEGKGGDIITKDTYGDFELVFEFNLTEKANSGIKYFVGTILNEETGATMINGPEYQIIDDFNHPEIKKDPNGLSSTASGYLLYKPKNKTLYPHGQWNSGKIVAKGKKVEHWLNGVKVVSYKRGSKDFLKRKAETKFKHDLNYGELESGHILLTDHGDQVYFRNIKIRRL